jgi:hypothetical protein
MSTNQAWKFVTHGVTSLVSHSFLSNKEMTKKEKSPKNRDFSSDHANLALSSQKTAFIDHPQTHPGLPQDNRNRKDYPVQDSSFPSTHSRNLP